MPDFLDKKLNVAVCFGGEPRTYDMCAENIHKFFNIPNVDVKFFAHTWTDNTTKHQSMLIQTNMVSRRLVKT